MPKSRQSKKKRVLSPYEKTHLTRYGKAETNIEEFDEIPVEYITGKVEFYSRVFQINKNTLIPRVETEELVSYALKHITRLVEKDSFSIADVGTGCGAIGITLFLELTKKGIPVQIIMSDISDAALEVAQQNIATLIDKSKISQIKLIQSDLLESYPKTTKFDLVVANLPYIPSPRISYLDKSVKNYEPHLALDGGKDGLLLIRKFIQQVSNYLKPQATVLLEVDYTHTQQELQKMSNHFKVTTFVSSLSKTTFAILKYL